MWAREFAYVTSQPARQVRHSPKAWQVGAPPAADGSACAKRDRKPFLFDRVFPPDTAQQQVFDEMQQLVQSAVDGFNVCVVRAGFLHTR